MENDKSRMWESGLYVLLGVICIVIVTVLTTPDSSKVVVVAFLRVSLFLFAVLLIRIPVVIARYRGISGRELQTISTLSWVGILLGITWIVALFFSLMWKTGKSDSDLEMLERLAKLKSNGLINDREFEIEKQKILKN